MSMEWKERGDEDNSYKARQIAHEANTSIEYGEKTWTTAQTVRDLMQNHLDAETERYYKEISSIVFGGEKLADKKLETKSVFENFLYSLYMFSSHVEDMTPDTRLISEDYLRKLANDLPIKPELTDDGVFQPSKFLEQTKQLSEHIPNVSFDIIDVKKNKSLGLISYEALRDEPLYQKIESNGKDEFRYKISGMKIVDHGTGYDSQLSSLYLSSKTGKKYVRGKFGEGAKMSELHLLRNKAKIKIRSQYMLKDNEGKDINRLWQVKSKIRDGRLVSEGVEIEKTDEKSTGSMIHLSFKNADEDFQKELIKNIDPRIGGLSNNISEFGSQNLVYPMPLSDKTLVGIDVHGSGDIQYVQGLRVELANESFGYDKPWFSYDILDSSIIAGRDRNEIKEGIVDKIKIFWENNNNVELFKKLVFTVVKDKTKSASSSELTYFRNVLSGDIGEYALGVVNFKKIQEIVDKELINQLVLEKNVATLVCSGRQFDEHSNQDLIEYAQERGYKIITTAADIYNSGIENFSKRISKDYKVLSLTNVQNEIDSLNKTERDDSHEFVEGEHEKKIREVFASAVKSVDSLITTVGIAPKTITLDFEIPPDEQKMGRYDDYGSSDYDKHKKIWIDHGFLVINPHEVSHDPDWLQRKIEIYLLSAYAGDLDKMRISNDSGYYSEELDEYIYAEETSITDTDSDTLKLSQHFLDSLITNIIPDNSSLLQVIPNSFEYEKNPAILDRLLESITKNGNIEKDRELAQKEYNLYLKSISTKLSLKGAKEILSNNHDYGFKNIIQSRVFVEDGVLHYYDQHNSNFDKKDLKESNQISNWNKFPIYKLKDGRFFISAPMNEGAVITKGEGKNKGYIFNEGDNFLEIGEFGVDYLDYRKDLSVQPDGIVISKQELSQIDISTAEYIKKQLEEYVYYPTGSLKNNDNKIIEGIATTSIPLEYGKDEWDNPIRVFQDIVQNHIDASIGLDGVKIIYEVNRGEKRIWIEENDITSNDEITGLSVSDNGEGYSPSEIATMGASSKKSPLFSGKYGEGQKMVAAAALRSGLNLEYQSAIKNNGEIIGWHAQAVTEDIKVVLDGEEVKKKLVAFEVVKSSKQSELKSYTTLKLSKNTSIEEKEQWMKWVSIIDPRKKDENNNSGMSRFVRQLRKPESEKKYNLGKITLLLDEPGAVYENGLRINPGVESGRSLSYGYDVPEIVTTRERNSYNPQRLKHYINHIFTHTTDTTIIKNVLIKTVNENEVVNEMNLNNLRSYKSAMPLWSKVAKEIWPDFLVHSSSYYHDFNEDFFGIESDSEKRRRIEKQNKGRFIDANIVHFNRNKILFLSKDNYEVFSKMLPTLESAVEKLKTQTVPVSLSTKEILSNIVAESTKIFNDIHNEAKKSHTPEQLTFHPLSHIYKFDEKIKKWSDAEGLIKDPNGVTVAPIDSGFYGKMDEGVIFNESLLLGDKNDKHKLAEVSLHEIAHLISGQPDYSEEFVSLLYELAKHFTEENSYKKTNH